MPIPNNLRRTLQERPRRASLPMHVRFPSIVSPLSILAILTLINLINYMDRQIIGPLVPLLQLPASKGGIGLSDAQAGLLQAAFMVVHSAASIPLGVMADRLSRTRLIAAGVGVWSIATALSAFSRSFGSMFVARAAVGIGEATYAPAASALISDTFSRSVRARAMGIFQSGMMLGGALAVIAGGWIGGHFGWRAAFLVVGLPGLVLTGLILLVREKPPRRAERDKLVWSEVYGSTALAARAMLRSPAMMWINGAGVMITFLVGALVFWGPSFILRYHYNNDESQIAAVSIRFGSMLLPCVLAGTLGGAFLADRLEKQFPGAGRLYTLALGTLLAIPCALFGIWTESLVMVYLAMGAGVLFASSYVGPILAALHDVVPPNRRGTATGVYLLVIHLLGDAISPSIVGWIADESSLRIGLTCALAGLLLGAIAALCAVPHARKIADAKVRVG